VYQEICEFIQNNIYKTDEFIPLHRPVFTGNEKIYLNECIDSNFVSSVGQRVIDFENMIANYTGAKKAVATVNGTAALHIGLKLLGVDANSDVITQPITFVATCNAISYCNANPVFVDVDRDTMGLSPEHLENFLNENVMITKSGPINRISGNKVSACVPMHTFGHPCRIDEIVSICDKYMIPVLEDAAESLGSFYKGKHTGTFGKIGIISFNGNKIITTGGGGMVISNDDEITNRAKFLTTTAKTPHPFEYTHDVVGYNYRLPNLNAALGCAQMEQLANFVEVKRNIAKKYMSFFDKIPDIDFFVEPTESESNYWLNAIILKDRLMRDSFLENTNNQGVMTRPIWTLMNKLPMFSHFQTGKLTNSQWLEDRVVNIPSSVPN